ncbi:MAG: J domain-containing protein [bacterium]
MDYYQILGISVDSSLEDIKKAYHKKAHENHPDKGGSETEMKLVNLAYQELLKIDRIVFSVNPSHQNHPERPRFKCKTCGKDTFYPTCIECWIKVKREEKRQRVHNIRSFMFCLNCSKSLYNRPLITLFCDTKCAKEYHKNIAKFKIKKPCSSGKCLTEEDVYRLEKIEIEKVFNLRRRERVAIFTRLLGKDKAIWFDAILQEKFGNV